MRDYTIAHVAEEGDLRKNQRLFIAALLSARPENGFRMAESTNAETLEGYVGRNFWYHIKGALAEGEEPPMEWIKHPDQGGEGYRRHPNPAPTLTIGLRVILPNSGEGGDRRWNWVRVAYGDGEEPGRGWRTGRGSVLRVGVEPAWEVLVVSPIFIK